MDAFYPCDAVGLGVRLWKNPVQLVNINAARIFQRNPPGVARPPIFKQRNKVGLTDIFTLPNPNPWIASLRSQ
jgi:hypothetical protein